MLRLVEINTIGKIKFEIVFPTKLFNNKSIGCNTPAEVIAPVVNIKVISIGNKQFVNPTNFCTVSFTKTIQPEKLVRSIVVTNINSTKYVICDTLFLLPNDSFILDKMLCITIIIKTIPN